jgi:hypothetical protein
LTTTLNVVKKKMLKFAKFLKTIIPYLVWNVDVESLFYVAKSSLAIKINNL